MAAIAPASRRGLVVLLLAVGVGACTPEERTPQTGSPAGRPAASAALPCAATDPAAVASTESGACLVAARRHTAGSGRPLLVFLHGDSGGSIRQAAWSRDGERVASWGAAAGVTAVQLVRPGYTSPAGRSAGSAKANDDDYTAANIRLVAEVLATLKRETGASRLVLVGHSGGAATAALLGGLHPGIADALVLVGCPCANIAEWRAWRAVSAGRRGVWSESLSPIDHAGGLPRGLPVMVLTGSADTNTLPVYGARYAQRANSTGAEASFAEIPGATHESAPDTREVTAAIVSVAR
jgi:pimeloyl-ACP methyl ester carboxylesterase